MKLAFHRQRGITGGSAFVDKVVLSLHFGREHFSATVSLSYFISIRSLLSGISFPVLREMPIAIKTEKPKEQHYEVPTSFFKLVLGKHLKYRYFCALQLNIDIFIP